MNKGQSQRRLGWALSTLAVAVSSTAVAQIEEVIVTAERREQSLQEVPVAVSAFDSGLLNELQINNVSDLEMVSPSLTFTQSTNALNSSANIRGIGTAVFSSAVEPSVSFVVDGVVMARQGQAFTDLIDIERVEVLRGPQSTLFGKNASAGVVSIVTQAPTEEFSGAVDVTAAEMDEYAVRATVSGPIASDLGFRLTAFDRRVGGHIKNVFDGTDLNGSDSQGVRGKLQWTPGDAEFTLIGDYSEVDSDCCAFVPVDVESPFLNGVYTGVLNPGEDNRQVTTSAPFQNDSTAGGLSLEANWSVGTHTATSITSWRKWDFINNGDIDSTPDTTGQPSQLLAPVPVLPQVGTLNLNSGATDINQYSQEFRLASATGEKFEYIVGLYGFRLELDRTFSREICFVDLAPCPTVINPAPGVVLPGRLSGSFNGNFENTNLAAFGQGTWHVSEQLSLFAGARFIYEDLNFDSVRRPVPLNAGDLPLGPFFEEQGGFDDTAVTGRIGGSYHFSDSTHVYASYNRGYKGPTLDLAFVTVPDPVDPETSDAFEIGLKSLLLEQTLQLNIALFSSEYRNYQAQGFAVGDEGEIGDGQFVLDNVGEVSSRGIEAEFVYQPNAQFSLRGGVTYADAKIDSFPNAQCFNPISQDPDCDPVTRTKDISGGDLVNAPELRANLNARYDFDIEALGLRAFVQAAGRYQSDTQFSLAQNPNTIQDAFTTVDASIGVSDRDERWLLTGFVQNLFDETFANGLLQHPTETATSNIFQFVPKRAERFFGMRLRYSF
ncbi:MAG: TonB-dependent receptor [Halieaceae bacterium]|nr:TonB-dependent receptor [Halieaceae bacterium]